jgi:hypothetical protein
MTIYEAKKISNIWSQWYCPTHFILFSIFGHHIPESFLPYPKDILEEALNIVAKLYYNNGDYQASKDIQESRSSFFTYEKDADALNRASKDFSNLEIMETRLRMISSFKKEWEGWLKKQEN